MDPWRHGASAGKCGRPPTRCKGAPALSHRPLPMVPSEWVVLPLPLSGTFQDKKVFHLAPLGGETEEQPI